MHLDIEIKNLGKIKQANFKINKFTILAGANSSGKSFITKALYSFFSTINKDFFYLAHLESRQLIQLNVRSLKRVIESINAKQEVLELYESLANQSSMLSEIILTYDVVSPFMEENAYTMRIMDCIEEFIKIIQEFQLSCSSAVYKYDGAVDFSESIRKQLVNIRNTIQEPARFLADTYSTHFKDSLKENFQTKSLASLVGDDVDNSIDFNFKGLGQITIKNDELFFELERKGIKTVRDFRSVVFIESPVYWKLKSPLLAVKEQMIFHSATFNKDRFKALNGVPKHFYDLIDHLAIKHKDRNSDELLSIKDAITHVLGGEIILGDNNELFFNDKNCNKKIDLNLTASGINNLGLLALLLEKNIIKEGSFVFLDEPEVNLHPAWQKIMVEVLYKLSTKGVNVVMATHSQDMLKYIQNIMDEMTLEEVEEHFSVLHLTREGISGNSDLTMKQTLHAVQADLGQTYYEMSLASDSIINWFRGNDN